MIRLRILTRTGEAALGPGKADLLEHIANTGSIAAAAREMGMSYRRAWGLIQMMNRAFLEPIVSRETGGFGGGGASLTPTGRKVLKLYREAEAAALKATSTRLASIRDLMNDPEP